MFPKVCLSYPTTKEWNYVILYHLRPTFCFYIYCVGSLHDIGWLSIRNEVIFFYLAVERQTVTLKTINTNAFHRICIGKGTVRPAKWFSFAKMSHKLKIKSVIREVTIHYLVLSCIQISFTWNINKSMLKEETDGWWGLSYCPYLSYLFFVF